MNELIWFSIPGAIVVAGILAACRCRLDADGIALISVAAVPIVGFIVHQASRAIFEVLGGWHSHWRRVIDEIQAAYPPRRSRTEAFHVWELTFYGRCTSQSFIDHNRGAWHYAMSFMSIMLAAHFTGIMHLILSICLHRWNVWMQVAISLVVLGVCRVVAVLFGAKLCLTLDALTKEECAYFRCNRTHFDATARRLGFLEPGSEPAAAID